jgi:hypothetical protein
MSYDHARADKIMASALDNAANIVSGLSLEAIGEDGHQVANLLWKISGYLRGRAAPDAGAGAGPPAAV